MEINEDHPARPYLQRAEAAYRRGDAGGCDRNGERAAQRLEDEPPLRGEFAVLHVAWLLGLRAVDRAGARCDAYLGGVATGPDRSRLRVLRAEILAERGRAAEAERETADLRLELLAHERSLSEEDEARVLRVEGVTAGEAGDGARAVELLERARKLFVRAGHTDAAADTVRERERLAVQAGDMAAVRAVADRGETGRGRSDRGRTGGGETDGGETDRGEAVRGEQAQPADEFVRALALKRLCRYEEALEAVTDCAGRPDLPPGMRWLVLREITLLLRALGKDETADGLTDLSEEAVACADDPAEAEAGIAWLRRRDAPPDGTVMGELQYVLRLLALEPSVPGKRAKDELRTVEQILLGVRDRVAAGHEQAVWHLAAGELESALHRRLRGSPPDRLRDAIVHLGLAAEQAQNCGQVEVRVRALRLLGHAYYRRRDGQDDVRRAGACWDEARRLDEGVVAMQVSDEVRRGMGAAVADTADEWADAAAEEWRRSTAEEGRRSPAAGRHRQGAGEKWDGAAAAVLAALESARGGALLTEILPGTSAAIRNLPRPGDHQRAVRWARAVARRLPRSRAYAQAVWLMHATPEHVHHALLTREGCRPVSVTCGRAELQWAVDRLVSCWSSEEILEKGLEHDVFGARLAEVAELVGVDEVLRTLPDGIGRIAVVAGGLLAEVPFGAVQTSGGPLGVRYALSDLPCLSALAPLRRRGRSTRGFSRLVVSPRPKGTGDPAKPVHPAEPVVPAETVAPAEPVDPAKPVDPAERGPRETVVDETGTPDDAAAALRRPPRRLMMLDQHATPEALRTALDRRRYRLVRIYAHGRHHYTDSGRSKLQLAPENSPQGAVFTDDLQRMNLRRCGTLVLGACESGMAQRIGADERAGFVRAAFVAGAASAVAARWVAPADVAAELLGRFESYARHEPRDVALQLAQRDVHFSAGGDAAPAPYGRRGTARAHPANWACWTLYGDSGFQTRAGPVRRRVRSTLRKFTTRRRRR